MGEVEEALGERDGERVLTMAGSEARPVSLVQRPILRRLVGRIADHDVITAAENPAERLRVFRPVDVPQRICRDRFEVLLACAGQSGPRPVEQGVAGRHAELEGGCVGETTHVGRAERGDAQAEAGDCGGEGIQVDARHLFENAARPLARVRARLVPRPQRIQAPKRAEQEVSRSAGRIDQAHFPEAELLDCGRERAIEDELLHEFGRLEQRVALAGALGEILVEVAQEARVPGGIREVVREGARLRIDPLPQAEQPGRRVAGEDLGVERPERIVPLVEYLSGNRERRHRAENVQQVLAIGLFRLRAEIEVVLVECPAAPVAGPGQTRRIDEGVVLEEPHEDAAENPGDSHLHQVLVAPGVVGIGGALTRERLPVLLLEGRFQIRAFPAPRPQVVFEVGPQARQIREQSAGVDHAPPRLPPAGGFRASHMGGLHTGHRTGRARLGAGCARILWEYP